MSRDDIKKRQENLQNLLQHNNFGMDSSDSPSPTTEVARPDLARTEVEEEILNKQRMLEYSQHVSKHFLELSGGHDEIKTQSDLRKPNVRLTIFLLIKTQITLDLCRTSKHVKYSF